MKSFGKRAALVCAGIAGTMAMASACSGSDLADRTDECCFTSWGSQITMRPPVDQAWVGAWALSATYAPGPGRLLQSVISGVTLEVEADGRYVMDYSDARIAPTGAAPFAAFELDGHEVAPPIWAMPPGATPQECGAAGPHLSGFVTGKMRARFALGLPGAPNARLLATAPYMMAAADPEASDEPMLDCDGEEGPLARLAGPALGVGAEAVAGGAQSYDYAVYDDTTMIVMGRGGGVTYVFTRQGS